LISASEARDARRTDRYLDRLMAADERRAAEVPAEVELDPSVRAAARQLRAGSLRVHPSFRFEEGLAGRLAAAAARLEAGLPIDPDVTLPAASSVVALRPSGPGPVMPAVTSTRAASAPWPLKLPPLALKPSRPLIVGGVGVASAALSIGAVYVAWRWSHQPGPMTRAVRAAHSRSVQGSHRSLRAAVLGGILGVVS
jgi:hypothetical protein